MSLIRSIHHVRFACKDVWQMYRLFAEGFGYKFHCYSKHGKLVNFIVKNGQTRFVLSEISNLGNTIPSASSSYVYELANRSVNHDRPFDMALEVVDVYKVCDRVNRTGGVGRVVLVPTIHSDYHGKVTMAVIESCIGGLFHTVLDTSNYHGLFLPGCVVPELGEACEIGQRLRTTQFAHESMCVSHFDHFAVACEVGQTDPTIQWYRDIFGMRRIQANCSDVDASGFVVAYGDTGMRLKAIGSTDQSHLVRRTVVSKPDSSENNCQLVFVEPLIGSSPNQVTRFLNANEGPGIQHIGLSVDHIVEAVTAAKAGGVNFVCPPDSYYDQLDSADNSYHVEQLKKVGVLLDTEVSGSTTVTDNHDKPHLLQVFTKYLFKEDAFFLELIQRYGGAKGFGAANITALWRALEVSTQQRAPIQTGRTRAPTT